jgi:glutathione S-transferase
MTSNDPQSLTLFGRSSSHFTRITRLFAAELGIEYSFEIVRDLRIVDPVVYGGNPALKVPVLRTPRGAFFGALNICRELERQSKRRLAVVWPEDLAEPLFVNAQELITSAMSTEVSLVMAKIAGEEGSLGPSKKQTESLLRVVEWLETNVEQALFALPPDRDLSYLEVSLYCLVTHLEFRELLPTAPYETLNTFCRHFAQRASAQSTAFAFDR